jgi:hypothetical protein
MRSSIDEHMIAYGGLAPAMRLAERCGLGALVGEHVAITAADGGQRAREGHLDRGGHVVQRGRARGASLRRRIIGVPARIARHGRGHVFAAYIAVTVIAAAWRLKRTDV